MKKPRLGFLGVGWIGRHRMDALARSGVAEVVAVVDPDPMACAAARSIAPGATVVETYAALLDEQLDGVVIATPSALHAEQARQALQQGLAVFCQKPLARDLDETVSVVSAAEKANRLLDVDFSYRHTRGLGAIEKLAAWGELGDIFSAELVFHNAYGPDKPWFYDPALSGGGCLIDLGGHLIDAALWCLGFPQVRNVDSRLYAGGVRLGDSHAAVEDFANVRLDLDNAASVQLACSWNLAAGRDAIIEARFYGTRGGAALYNVNGSFYDFVAERYQGTRSEVLSQPPDAWGGRGLVAWAQRLARQHDFDADAWRVCEVAEVLDRAYGRRPGRQQRPASSRIV